MKKSPEKEKEPPKSSIDCPKIFNDLPNLKIYIQFIIVDFPLSVSKQY